MKIFRHLTVNNITLKPFDFTRELSMQAYLVENQDVLALDDDELSNVSIIDAEVPLAKGRRRKSKDGRIDLLAAYGSSTIGVLELKRGELNDRHLRQLEDYLSETKQLLDIARDEIKEEEPKFVGILVGNMIDSGLAGKIQDGYLINGQIPVAALILRRYRGDDNSIYIVTDTIFHNTSRKFDFTKYSFKNEIYGKCRLVLAVIRDYVENHPQITYSELEKKFPRRLQGSWGCFITEEDAVSKFEKSNHKRYYIAPSEIISLKDSMVAVSSQWGKGNIKKFLKRTTELGYRIEKSTKSKKAK